MKKDRRKPCIECGQLCWSRKQKCKDCSHRFGKISKFSKEQVVSIIKESSSKSEVFYKMGLIPAGANYRSIERFIIINNIDISHFTGQSWSKGQNFGPKRPLQDYLDNKYAIASHSLRQRLLSEGIFERKCYGCNLTEWLGNEIPLELDHINGVHEDNTLSNLRLLCPNCHALTDTYRGKNKKVKQCQELL